MSIVVFISEEKVSFSEFGSSREKLMFKIGFYFFQLEMELGVSGYLDLKEVGERVKV